MTLAQTQMAHAQVIVGVCRARNLGIEAAVIALEVGISESGLRVLANPSDPTSMALPNDGVGADHLSVGIFQQQPGWGSVAARMDPATSCGLFLDAMVRTDPGWAAVTRWVVAQDVQVSAYDGNPRTENNWNGVYGGNYMANDAQAVTLAGQLWSQPAPTATTEDPMIIIFAPNTGIAEKVPGGKYHLDGNEWNAVKELHARVPAAVIYTPISQAAWNVLAEKRGKL